ncbi:MAG TPA: hypothetical protein VGN18_18920 [Jatrophihabitans sp.]|uniref:S53 family peptidase n=1 Tax=Jatrophihabitans sp. TaxID=1932789 RepID=UPI002E0A7193|nr:hypothetical protein [Jatrophihabitans sp.]
MKHLVLTAAAGATLLAATVLPTTSAGAAPAQASGRHSARTCAAAPAGYAACDARVVVDNSGKPVANATPSGYGPADIQSAYKLAGLTTGSAVAIVDAYNDPTAAADLAVYRSQYGLPACTVAGGCLRITNQSGGSNLPQTNAGWATEISLDLDMVSAACPSCKILLVEAGSASFANLGAGVNYAATQSGVKAISNSYGGSDTAQSSAYNHPGIAVTASTGDSGYGIQSPASYDAVVAVGGTSLTRASNSRGWSESAWSGAGSGCSTLNAKPSWQTGVTQCSGKAAADVSAVADPNTGVAVYDSTSYQGRKGWQVYGGTSASSPIVAGVYALSGNTSGYPASIAWGNPSGLNDVSSGSNGTCSPAVWCTSGAGWDGPTGLGTPNGTSSF